MYKRCRRADYFGSVRYRQMRARKHAPNRIDDELYETVAFGAFRNVPRRIRRGKHIFLQTLPAARADGGEFTVIGYLEAGKTYEMCEDTSGSGRRFSIESGELREFGADVKPATAAASVETSGIYRIYVDFNTRATIVEQVTKLAMYQRDNVGGAVELTYQGLGVWLLEKHTTEDGDNRYGFVATLSGDTTYQEKWSSVNYNNNDAPTSGSAPDWWKI